MTNEEKIHQYCTRNLFPSGLATRENIEKRMLYIAKWKDKQFAEEKKELLGLVQMLPVDSHNQTIIEDLLGLLS